MNKKRWTEKINKQLRNFIAATVAATVSAVMRIEEYE